MRTGWTMSRAHENCHFGLRLDHQFSNKWLEFVHNEVAFIHDLNNLVITPVNGNLRQLLITRGVLKRRLSQPEYFSDLGQTLNNGAREAIEVFPNRFEFGRFFNTEFSGVKFRLSAVNIKINIGRSVEKFGHSKLSPKERSQSFSATIYCQSSLIKIQLCHRCPPSECRGYKRDSCCNDCLPASCGFKTNWSGNAQPSRQNCTEHQRSESRQTGQARGHHHTTLRRLNCFVQRTT
jgi:hypothetical protein